MSLTETKPDVLIEIDTRILENIEEQGITILHCTYTTSPKWQAGWWFNITRNSYLANSVSGDRLEMLHAINVPLSPERKYLKNFGDTAHFTLIFPKVPSNWLVFDFIEGGGDGFRVLGIKRNNSSVYRVKIE